MKLYYKETIIAQITNINQSIGWISGEYIKSIGFAKVQSFLYEYSKLEDDWGDPEFWEPGIENLKNEFGAELVDESNWKLVLFSENEQKNTIIPFFDFDMESSRVTWR
ncbi:MAG: hypothetical protein HC831_17310 [Chloroflexia bacterium]|nr:hypothetical protein [Chloroflexia bacterium]